MASMNDSLCELLNIDGALGCCVVDSSSGLVLGQQGGGVDLDLAGAGNTEVVRAKLKAMSSLGLKDQIEDILITLSTQYHVIRPVARHIGLFIYLVLDKNKSNLALARRKAMDVEAQIQI